MTAISQRVIDLFREKGEFHGDKMSELVSLIKEYGLPKRWIKLMNPYTVGDVLGEFHLMVGRKSLIIDVVAPGDPRLAKPVAEVE